MSHAIVFPKVNRTGTGLRRVDWNHPLSFGLIAAYLPGGQTGGTNLANPGAGNLTFQSGAVPNFNTPDGIALAQKAASSLGSATAPQTPGFISNPVSLFWRAQSYSNAPSPLGIMIGTTYDNANTTPFLTTGALYWNSGSLLLAWNSGGTPTNFSPGVTVPTAGVVESIGGTFPGPGQNVQAYYQGVAVGAATAFGASQPTSTATSQINLGGTTSVPTQNINSATVCAYMWNRSLSADEHARLHVDPFCFLTTVEGSAPILKNPSLISFRRTLSHLGTRAGSRQVHRI